MYEISKAIAEALVALGKSDNPEPSAFTQEEIDKYLEVSNHAITRSNKSLNFSVFKSAGIDILRYQLTLPRKQVQSYRLEPSQNEG